MAGLGTTKTLGEQLRYFSANILKDGCLKNQISRLKAEALLSTFIEYHKVTKLQRINAACPARRNCLWSAFHWGGEFVCLFASTEKE